MAPIHKTPSEEEIAKTLGNLQISTKQAKKPAQKPKSKPVADSWDEALSGSDTETEHVDQSSGEAVGRGEKGAAPLHAPSTTTSHDDPPNPPPPTPASPTQFEYPDTAPYSLSSHGPAPRGGGGGGPDKRPEKTTAVAGRLIAGALGVRAPKRTDEEREFDRAMREKERKRRADEREREKREAEAREVRKKAVWDD